MILALLVCVLGLGHKSSSTGNILENQSILGLGKCKRVPDEYTHRIRYAKRCIFKRLLRQCLCQQRNTRTLAFSTYQPTEYVYTQASYKHQHIH